MITSRYTPQTDSSNRSFQSNTLSKRSINESLTTRRAKQLLIYNQNSLNNLFTDATFKIPKSEAKQEKNLNPNFVSSENVLIKKPFKHFVQKSVKPKETQDFQDLRIARPSSSLLIKTAQNVNKFVDLFDKNSQVQSSPVMIRPPAKRPIQYSKYSGLKPLNLVYPEGPAIRNCIGIINEPKNQNADQIKEIYRLKMKQLEKKKMMDDYLGITDSKEFDPNDLSTARTILKTPRSLF